ncbi:hypothetical protein E2C01_095296 [Portunus trituberculatus]|uniref:Uncharacterized protein n=1 Tax=Portunus trituberculatus TaxID=210409 RepID=A0A5B7K5E8_PORTR|nr:hypothetical protein [Portunus trituberculatus]
MRQTKQQSYGPVHQEETQQSSPKQQMQQTYKSVQSEGHPKSPHHKHSQQSDMPNSSRFFRMLQTITDTLPDGAGMKLK